MKEEGTEGSALRHIFEAGERKARAERDAEIRTHIEEMLADVTLAAESPLVDLLAWIGDTDG